jgi:prophage DNA circulation protein
MAVYLDDEILNSSGPDLGSSLDVAQNHLVPVDPVAVEVQLNGQTLAGNALDRYQNESLQDAKLRLYSATPAELATTTLEQARAELQHARQEQIAAAELLQQDNRAEAMQKVSQVIEIWLQSQQVLLQITRLLGLRLDDLHIDDRTVSERTQRILEQIQSLRNVIQAGDTVGLTDALAYEWPEICDQWDHVFEELVHEIERMQSVRTAKRH